MPWLSPLLAFCIWCGVHERVCIHVCRLKIEVFLKTLAFHIIHQGKVSPLNIELSHTAHLRLPSTHRRGSQLHLASLWALVLTLVQLL